MSTHRTLDGAWETCAIGGGCQLAFHVELSVADAEQLPDTFVEKLAEAFDPPTHRGLTGDNWTDADGEWHRDYDLPTSIPRNGARFWYQHGKRHRSHGKPAAVWPGGYEEWWENDMLIRTSYGTAEPEEPGSSEDQHVNYTLEG